MVMKVRYVKDAKQRMKETATKEGLGAAWLACGAPFPYPLAPEPTFQDRSYWYSQSLAPASANRHKVYLFLRYRKRKLAMSSKHVACSASESMFWLPVHR